ncbi:MAG: amino acid adenylation domain-containing protein, partial [Gemmatimonadetes bacterium]|nr:amino acid adenylation domain-containing protein [Gemmatimonadota bacterium]
MSTHAPPPHDAPAGPAPGLTASERRIWTGQRLDPAAPLYNMALAITIEGALDVPRFQRAFARLVEETDALRTTFPERNGQPERQVHASPSGTLDIEHWPLAQVDDDAVAQRLAARTRRLFDVATGPLFDSVLVRRAPDLHVWYLNQHHLITDAWSVGVLHRRLGALYEADGAPLPDAPPFADFVQHERGLRDAPPLLRARAHWGDRAEPRALGFYGDTRPGSGRTRRVRVPLGADRAEHLARLAASPPFRSLSPEQSRFLVVATVLTAWIHRVADTRDVALGTPWHNRITPRQRETAGLFIELYPVRVHVEEGESFTSLARTLGASTLETLRHVVPGASAAPGAHDFAVVLNAITARMGPFAGRPTRAEWIHAGAGDPAHRLRVQVHDFDAQGEPVIDFDLDERTFGPREREWAVRHFLALFDALAADDTALVAAVPLVSADEEAVFAAPVVETEPAPTVPAQIAEQIRAWPHAVAVRDGDVRLTYGTLAERARALGAALQAAGVEPGDVVGVCLERSAALIVALLGVWEAGAAWLPLDPAHPEPRRAALLEDARARAVVTADVLAPSLRALDRPVLTVDREGRTDAPGGASQPGAPAPGRAHLAYVLYTSGSTGSPKGVEVEHGALADYVRWARDVYTDGEPLAFALFTSPAFDLTLTSIFTPLVAGGAVVVYRDAVHSGLLVRRVLEDDAVDVVKLTPSHLALLRDLDLRTARVRRLILGGEDLKGPLAAAVHDAFGGAVEILNEYGPTEATVGCMLHRFDRERDARGSVPIGRPAPDVRLRVLDAWGRPVPRGVIGELWIGGRRLARGYRGDAARTAERFVADASEPKLRFYRTGDRARWRPDGALDFLGRNDDQLKVRGVRIERAEVEAALLGYPDVHEAVAHLVRSGPSDVTCVRCGLEAAHPEALLDDQQVCAVCRRFERERAQVAGYFGTLDDLRGLLAEARAAT